MFLRSVMVSFLSLTLTVGFSSLSLAQDVPLKIAVVSIDRVLSQSAAARAVGQQVQATRDSYRSEIQAEENTLREANQALSQKQTLLDSTAFQAERRKFEQQVRDVQQKVQQRNASLQETQRKATQEIMKTIRKIVFDLSVERGYSLVLRNAQTLIVHETMDITAEVLNRLNTQLPTVSLSTQ